jgi:hypothetical protein
MLVSKKSVIVCKVSCGNIKSVSEKIGCLAAGIFIAFSICRLDGGCLAIKRLFFVRQVKFGRCHEVGLVSILSGCGIILPHAAYMGAPWPLGRGRYEKKRGPRQRENFTFCSAFRR